MSYVPKEGSFGQRILKGCLLWERDTSIWRVNTISPYQKQSCKDIVVLFDSLLYWKKFFSFP